MWEHKVFLHFYIMDGGQENPSSPFNFSGENIRFGKKVTQMKNSFLIVEYDLRDFSDSGILKNHEFEI